MKLYCHSEIDSLYIEFASKPSSDSREISLDLVADFDETGRIVGLDIQHASQRLDLAGVEVIGFPFDLSA